jgi:ribosomal protein L23
MKLLKPQAPQPKNVVQFIVSTEMTRFDVANYLTKIYKVPVVNVALHNHFGEFKRAFSFCLLKIFGFLCVQESSFFLFVQARPG